MNSQPPTASPTGSALPGTGLTPLWPSNRKLKFDPPTAPKNSPKGGRTRHRRNRNKRSKRKTRK